MTDSSDPARTLSRMVGGEHVEIQCHSGASYSAKYTPLESFEFEDTTGEYDGLSVLASRTRVMLWPVVVRDDEFCEQASETIERIDRVRE